MIFTSVAMLLSCITIVADDNNLVVNNRVNFHDQYAEITLSKNDSDNSSHQFSLLLTYNGDDEYYSNQLFFRGGYSIDDEDNSFVALEFFEPLYTNVFVTLHLSVNDEFGNEDDYYSPCVYDSPYNQYQRYDDFSPFESQSEECDYLYTLRIYVIPQSVYQSSTDNYNVGYQNGYDNGYNEGQSKGEEIGEERGYEIGYDIGKAEGVQEGIETGHITEIFANIMQFGMLPVNFFLQVLNIEVFGINIGGFVSGLLSIAIIIIILRLVLGSSGGGK